jgi:hypothetical protein
MKVEKSSKECAEYNTSHQAEIDLGLIFPLEPSDQILAGEKLQAEREATESFIKDNAEFCKMVGHSSYNDGVTVYGLGHRAYYQTAFLVNEDGSVKIGGETFQPSQWVEIFTLRTQQAEAMKALKDSFKVAVAVAA